MRGFSLLGGFIIGGSSVLEASAHHRNAGIHMYMYFTSMVCKFEK